MVLILGVALAAAGVLLCLAADKIDRRDKVIAVRERQLADVVADRIRLERAIRSHRHRVGDFMMGSVDRDLYAALDGPKA